MDIHSDFVEPVTPGLPFENVSYWKSEDSGYTSYTPGSLECSEISSDNLNPSFLSKISYTGKFQVDCYDYSKEQTTFQALKYNTSVSRSNDYKDSPINRRGIKRVLEDAENTDINGSIPTPTSMIAGGLHKLRFNDSQKLNASFTSVSLTSTDFLDSEYFSINDHIKATFPSTPIKKVCRSSCKLNSPLNPKRPVKKLNFVIHSLSCDTQALQPLAKCAKQNDETRLFQYKPNQKIDIIKMLYFTVNAVPPITKIFDYLSHEDVHNFTLVSPLWQKVWEDVGKKSKQHEYLCFRESAIENQENKMTTPKNSDTKAIRPLMEICNVMHNQKSINSPSSPPGTPRTIRFKRYTKAASLDSRKQLSCVRCCQPSKVTEESSGEVWVECTNTSCSYQFCKFCKCERHPGKKCFQYDLDGPSPSKRKKSSCAIGTKKSRKNLRRLLSMT